MQQQQQHLWRQQTCRPATAAHAARRVAAEAIRGVEAFDGAFELDDKQQGTLNELLHSEMFCQQVRALLLGTTCCCIHCRVGPCPFLLLDSLCSTMHGTPGGRLHGKEQSVRGTHDTHRSLDCACTQVVRECKLPEGAEVEWTGVLFQPVPWSVTSKKGMPPHIEERYHGKVRGGVSGA